MARKALGRGLSALLGENPEDLNAAAPESKESKELKSSRETRAVNEAQSTGAATGSGAGTANTAGAAFAFKSDKGYLELEIDLITPNSQQPRTEFSETELAELTQSIVSNGVVQPILVRKTKSSKLTKDERDTYELVAGERRWRAAQKAGLKRIPAIVREIDDDRMLEIALIENIQRQELNPVEESRAYKSLIEQHGLTQQEVADRVGKNRTFIANYLRLLSLPASILKYVENGQISVGHAKAILSVDSSQLQKQLANAIILKGLSVREAERAARRKPAINANKASNDAAAKQDPNLRSAETKLRRKFATQVRIIETKPGIAGRIELEYYNKQDLDRVYKLLIG